MPRKPTITEKSNQLLDMLIMRLRTTKAKLPFTYIFAVELNDEVVIFGVSKGEAMMIKDQAELYPSDALITQVRLLLQ